MKRAVFLATLLLTAIVAAAMPAAASSHREAPFVTEHPKVDGTDFYMFRSYEAGRENWVTLLANYLPLQDAYGGPNYFNLDSAARYLIKLDSDGDGAEDITFRFKMDEALKGLAIPVGPDGTLVAVPLKNIGQIFAGTNPPADPAVNVFEQYTVEIIREGDDPALLTNAATGSSRFFRPFDNVGNKSLPDYATYADQFIYEVNIPGCSEGTGRLFVGQRAEGFQVNLGEVFDLVNVGDPVGDPAGELSATKYKNVTTFALEVPKGCLTTPGGTIGGWTTSELPRRRTLDADPTFDHPASFSSDFVQTSRLGMPLVNEVVIGLPDKDKFNTSSPVDDLQFATYVTNPTLPELLEILFGVAAPNNFPRNDLLAAFVTGIDGINLFGFGEMQRLNTSIDPTPSGAQSNLGVLGGDLAGFPNGRRPGDDVVDIELRVAMGVLCHAGLGLCDPDDAPSGLLPFTDGALVEEAQFDATFPYLKDPTPGSPNEVNGVFP